MNADQRRSTRMGSAPATGATNRALAVCLAWRDALKAGGRAFGKRFFREGADDGRRGACAPPVSFVLRETVAAVPSPGGEGQGEGESTFSLTHFLTCARRHFWLPLLLQLNGPLNIRP